MTAKFDYLENNKTKQMNLNSVLILRRHPLCSNIDCSPSRRSSYQAIESIETFRSPTNLRNFYVFFLLLFFFLFLSLVYSFIRMMKNSWLKYYKWTVNFILFKWIIPRWLKYFIFIWNNKINEIMITTPFVYPNLCIRRKLILLIVAF